MLKRLIATLMGHKLQEFNARNINLRTKTLMFYNKGGNSFFEAWRFVWMVMYSLGLRIFPKWDTLHHLHLWNQHICVPTLLFPRSAIYINSNNGLIQTQNVKKLYHFIIDKTPVGCFPGSCLPTKQLRTQRLKINIKLLLNISKAYKTGAFTINNHVM